ncbi:hypothetical protein ADK67_37600 [Saccharothrix sp. NRRL B-16348]|uniref:hypothetical protein n=1 Tax=Saccharothrix sp. NRRL B-16348 TaxID=1415542 RepID=UPI0006AE991F|nr:hypothetical protein [Saccharothrix sp. NRRL B-16348]KOX17909.1 hypothetical protein ADK67_37600 [Saccharothrix sp. NRRL B-16348]
MSRPDGETEIRNTVEGDHNRTVQVGVVNGGAVFHGDSTVYQFTKDDPPKRKYEVACNHLAGGSPRIAEGLLTEVIRAGLASTAVAYHYALATLSERSINQLGSTQFEQIKTASSIADRFPHDSWRAAIDVIRDLMMCATAQEHEREPDRQALDDVLSRFKVLSEQRREEITRHLDMIIGGAMQDRLDRDNSEAVAEARVSGDRSERAWKFFEATPAEPRLVTPYEDGRVPPRTWVVAVLGGIALIGGLVVTVGAAGADVADAVAAWTALVVLAHGVAVWLGARVVASRRRRQRLEVEHGGRRVPEAVENLHRLGSKRFRADVLGLIEREIVRQHPKKHVEGRRWKDDIERSGRMLYLRLVRTYGSVIPDPEYRDAYRRAVKREISAWTLHWLVRMHVRLWADRWSDGRFFAFRKVTYADVVQGVAGLLCTLIAVGGVAGVYVALGEWSGVSPLWGTTVAGVLLGSTGGADLIGRRLALSRERAECRALLEEEQAERKRCLEQLADRPTDAEMARWFDFDKAHLKAVAMKRAGLSNRDVIAHVVLTEGLPRAKRARVIYGPPRYSNYLVLVFLLTENGVREFRFDLQFEIAAVSNEQRASFSYGALVLVEVKEVGVQFAGEKRTIVLVWDNDDTTLLESRQGTVLSRALHLSLQNSRDISLVVENFEELSDKEENPEQLEELAFGASGITSALRILEAVAVEGREWIEEERRRRDRGFEEWKRTESLDPSVLPAAPHDDALALGFAEAPVAEDGRVDGEPPFTSPDGS